MTTQPDDPRNPRRPVPPRIDTAKEQVMELRKMAACAEQLAGPIMLQNAQISEELRAWLLLCFCAETDLKPSQCQMVQQEINGKTFWHFEKKESNDPVWQAECDAMKGTIVSQTNVIKKQQVEIDRLKQQLREARGGNSFEIRLPRQL